MPIKPLGQKKQLRILPMNRPEYVERDVYPEAQDSLLNFFNIVSAAIDKQKEFIVNNLLIESAGDVSKMAAALTTIARTCKELEAWQFEREAYREKIKDELIAEIRAAMDETSQTDEDTYKKLRSLILAAYEKNVYTLNSHVNQKACLIAPNREESDGTD